MRRAVIIAATLACACASSGGGDPSSTSGGLGPDTGSTTATTGHTTTTEVTATGSATSSMSTTTTREPGVCDFACEVFFECTDAYDSIPMCVEGCVAQFEPGGDAQASPCRESVEAWLMCISTLDCDQYAQWEAGDPDLPEDFPCKDETVAQREAC